MRGPEEGLMVAAAELLQLHHFLVFHQRPARMADGTWRSAVQFDGAGFPDLIAVRPECPIIAIEVKADTAVSKDQKDWLFAFQGSDRLIAVLRPQGWAAFCLAVEALVQQYPLPDGWIKQIDQRTWRHQMHKSKKRIASSTKEGKVPATVTTTMQLPHNTPVRLGSGKQVFAYRGHGSDGSVCVYGPMIYDGTTERWVPTKTAQFQSRHAELHQVRKP